MSRAESTNFGYEPSGSEGKSNRWSECPDISNGTWPSNDFSELGSFENRAKDEDQSNPLWKRNREYPKPIGSERNTFADERKTFAAEFADRYDKRIWIPPPQVIKIDN